jgi:hypothetical protein
MKFMNVFTDFLLTEKTQNRKETHENFPQQFSAVASVLITTLSVV